MLQSPIAMCAVTDAGRALLMCERPEPELAPTDGKADTSRFGLSSRPG
jgi:hypothetical protein